MPMNDRLSEQFKSLLDFQQSEKWRKFGWESEEASHVNVHVLDDESLKNVIPDVEKEILNRKYFVVQQYSEEMEPDGSMPVNIFIVDGKDIKDSFSMGNANGFDDAYAYGPSMASEMDIGYNSGTNYIMDVTNLSKRAQATLLRSSEAILEDVQERAVRSAEMGGYSSSYEEDSGYYDRKHDDYDSLSDNESYRNEERALYGRALDEDEVTISVEGTVKMVIANAFDNGAESPYDSIYAILDKSLEKDNKEIEEKQESVAVEVKSKRTVEEIAKSISSMSVVNKTEKKEEKQVEKKAEPKYKKVTKESVQVEKKESTPVKDKVEDKEKDNNKGKFKPVEKKSRGNAMYRLSQGQRRLVMFLTGRARKNNWLDKNGKALVFDQDAGDAKAELNRFIEGAKLNGFTFTPAINANKKRAQEKAKANNGTSDGR